LKELSHAHLRAGAHPSGVATANCPDRRPHRPGEGGPGAL